MVPVEKHVHFDYIYITRQLALIIGMQQPVCRVRGWGS